MKEIIVFTESYFDGKKSVSTLREAKQLIHDNPLNNIRVQIGNYRLLLHPAEGDLITRKIDGFSSLNETYKYFNDSNDPCSQITVGENGVPGEIYISHIKK